MPHDNSKFTAWIRGTTALLRTCKVLHTEAAHLMYSRANFAIHIGWNSVKFEFQYLWAWPGATRRRPYDFPQCFGEQYLPLIRNLTIKIHIVDCYLGMIKYNHSNPAGLLHGYRTQVEHLCNVLEKLPHLKRLRIWFRDDSATPGSAQAVLSPLSRIRTARTTSTLSEANPKPVAKLPPLTRSRFYPDYFQAEYCMDAVPTP
ncbi:MAG: hypothetical protein Q9213_008269 [Squamulea squamosa]